MIKKIKVLVAMSGGVDSSVTAALLVEQGYDVTGAFMVNYDTQIKQIDGEDYTDSSCWIPDYRDAVRVAAKLGIKLLRLNFTKEYSKKVLDYMYREYELGHTPNPDVLCNKYIKFGVWLDWALENGFDYLATGHYAIVGRVTGNGGRDKINHVTRYTLHVSRDVNKDQTYFLHQLNQEQFRHTLFPIGDYTKLEVRKLAKKFKLPTANKEESMGICFIGEVSMKEFLQKKIKNNPGDIVDSSGNILDKHDGLAFYTIGQRVGRVTNDGGRAIGGVIKPFFVLDKDIKKNQLIVGYEDDPLLYTKKSIVSDINWISGQSPRFPLKCKVRLRHRQALQGCILMRKEEKKKGNGKIKLLIHNTKYIIQFTKPQRAVTPGQFAVFYKNKECLGGGVIK